MSEMPSIQIYGRHLPPKFGQAIHEVGTHTQTPLDMVLYCALSAIAVASQRLIEVKLPHGTTPTSLMVMIVAKSGERKSSVEAKFFQEIKAIEAEHAEVYDDLYQEWQSQHTIWTTKNKVFQKKLSKLIEQDQLTDAIEKQLKQHFKDEPHRPPQMRVLYEDVTSAALFAGLHTNVPFAALVSAEGGSILNSPVFRDIPKLNKLWSGEEIIIDRKTGPSIHIRHARLTTSIMVQPEILRSYLEKSGEQARGAGFLARFLFSSGYSTQGNRILADTDTPPEWHALAAFNERIRELLESSFSSRSDGFQPTVIELSPKAQKLWIKTSNEIEALIRPNARFENASDHASKIAENIARVAGLLHYFEGYDGPISFELMQNAIDICNISSNNFLHYFNDDEAHRKTDELYQFLLTNAYKLVRKNGPLEYIPRSSITGLVPYYYRNKHRLNEGLNILQSKELISLNYTGKSCRISLTPKYIANTPINMNDPI